MTAETPWMTPDELAERLQLTPKTLANWRVKGAGPSFRKFGRHVRYRRDLVIDWENQGLTEGGAA